MPYYNTVTIQMLLMPTEEKPETTKEKLFQMPSDLCNQNSELSDNMLTKD